MKRIALLLALLALVACSDATGSTNGGGGTGRMTVQNRSAQTITQLYISPCSSSSLGGNRLGADVLPPNQDRSFDLAPDCYDVGAVTSTGGVGEIAAQQVIRGQTTVVTFTN